MKKILLLIYFLSISSFLLANSAYAKTHVQKSNSQCNSGEVYVRGYTRKNGTHVHSYCRTAPNHTTCDNYSTKGNINPHTNKRGTKRRNRNCATKS